MAVLTNDVARSCTTCREGPYGCGWAELSRQSPAGESSRRQAVASDAIGQVIQAGHSVCRLAWIG